MPELRESSLQWKYRSFTSSPQILLYPLESTPFHAQPLATTNLVFFFFLFTYFLSECYTNGIICYVALWVWLLSHTIIRDLSVMLRISLFSFYFVYFSEQPSIKGYVTVYPFISGRNLSCLQFLIVMNRTATRFMYRF